MGGTGLPHEAGGRESFYDQKCPELVAFSIVLQFFLLTIKRV